MNRVLVILFVIFFIFLLLAMTSSNNKYHYQDLDFPENMPEHLKKLGKMPPPPELDEFGEILASNVYVIGDENHRTESNITWDEIKLLAETQEEFKMLDQQLTAAKEASEKYKNIKTALEEGYYPLTSEIPWMGTHHIKNSLVDDVFNPAEPEGLDYVFRDGRWELAGVYYVVNTKEHPEGFASNLDVWHIHKDMCVAPGLVVFSSDKDECQYKDRYWIGDMPWMLHVWVHHDHPWGIFVEWNPSLNPEFKTEILKSP